MPAAAEGEPSSVAVPELRLGDRGYDLSDRALVMGILNRTRDSFYDGGAYFALEALLRRAERLIEDGADLLEVGARAAGVGTEEVPEPEEVDLAASTVAALRARFDVPVAVDTCRASVADAAFAEGAALGNDMSGFSDPAYLPAAVRSGAAVVATHIRLPPGVPDPAPVYREVVGDVAGALRGLARLAEGEGIGPGRIVIDPGLDLGKTWQQSLRLLGSMDVFAALGYPVLVAASNKIFLGRALGLERGERAWATVAACCYGIDRGARVLRVHDAAGARHAADLYAEMRRACRG